MGDTTAAPLVQTESLRKSYGDIAAVDGIDFEVRPGEVFGLLGPNGAGKTTTVLMLLGLAEPDEGRVRVCGLDPARHPLAVKRRVGYLPDTVGFYEAMSGRQNLRYTAMLNELSTDETEERIGELLSVVGLGEAGDRPVATYSRGMRKRLGVADTLVKDPEVVILDEPMVGIDPAGVIEMQHLIRRLADNDGRAVLLTSHLLHQVQRTCDRMAIFVSGRVVAEGSAASLAAELADGQSLYELTTDVDGSVLSQVLSDGLAGQSHEVEALGGNRWKVTVPSSETSRLVRVLVDEGVPVRELRDLGSDLDQIYHRYFRETPEVRA